MAREYKPNNRVPNPSQGTTATVPTGNSQLDHDAFVAACLGSECSSSTIDIADRQQVEHFAKAASSFHPQLVSLLNEWASSKNPEQTRDQLRIAGKSASEMMWEQGKTFIDVVCDAQRRLDGDVRKLPDISVSSVHEADSKPIKPHNPTGAKLNPLQRFANFVSRGAYERRLIAKVDIERRETLETLPASPQENEQHNKDILSAEQIVKDGMQEQQSVLKAADILNERRQEILRMQEKRAAHIESFMAAQKETQELLDNLVTDSDDLEDDIEEEFESVFADKAPPKRPEGPKSTPEERLIFSLSQLSGQVANRQGATVTVDLSTKAMAVAEVELSCIDEMLGDLNKDSAAMQESVQKSQKQLDKLHKAPPEQRGKMGELSEESVTMKECSDNTKMLVQAAKKTDTPTTESRINTETYSSIAYYADRVAKLPQQYSQKHPDRGNLADEITHARKFMMDDIMRDVSVRAGQMAPVEAQREQKPERARVRLKDLAAGARERSVTAVKANERVTEKAPKTAERGAERGPKGP